MTYNTDRRKPLTKKQRAQFLADHDYRCHWCGGLITDDKWADDHLVAKELMPPGSNWNDMSNRAPIHAHPYPCHADKTALDIAAIAKSNRLRQTYGHDQRKRKTAKKKIHSRGFEPGHRPIPSRPFPRKGEPKRD